MTADNSTIEIRLAGDDIRPETVRARDVAEIPAAFEQMVAAPHFHFKRRLAAADP